jgi:hypothetical protein
MSDLAVYRTADPSVLDTYAAAQAALLAYSQTMAETLERLGAGSWPRMISTGYRPGRLLGLKPSGGDVPAGWRVDARSMLAVPDLRTTAGREARKALDAIRYPGDPRHSLPGMPSEVMVPGHLLTCGCTRIGGVLYVTWTGDPAGAARIDSALWERCRLSEYYAAVEAAAQDGSEKERDR